MSLSWEYTRMRVPRAREQASRARARVRRSTWNAKALGSIPEALQQNFLSLVRGICAGCPDGAVVPSCVLLAEASPAFHHKWAPYKATVFARHHVHSIIYPVILCVLRAVPTT
eukprot:4147958-Prymnesium_polylepis.1